MTEEELDLLASAYVDGETTSEEVAVLRDVVEPDPDLAARFAAKVDALRAITAQVGSVPPAPASLKDQQLAAALALFDEIKPSGGQVLDFEARSKALPIDATAGSNTDSPADSTTDSLNRARRLGARRMPQWMPAAAVFLLIGGGLVFLVANSGGNDFDAATDAVDSAASDESGEDTETGAAESAELTQADADIDAEANPAVAADGSAERAEADSADDAANEDDAMEEESAADETPAAADSGEPSQGGFFPGEPAVVYRSAPDLEELAKGLDDLPDLLDPELSTCGAGLEIDETSVLAGFLPVEVADVPAELFFVFDSAGDQTAVIVDTETCNPIG